jgi:bacteriorhodopsin
MLAAGVLGSFAGHTKVRWVWLVISCLAYLVLVHHGGFHAQRAAGNKDVRTKRFFAALSGLGLFAFALFPMYVEHLTFSLLILFVGDCDC